MRTKQQQQHHQMTEIKVIELYKTVSTSIYIIYVYVYTSIVLCIKAIWPTTATSVYWCDLFIYIGNVNVMPLTRWTVRACVSK